MKCWLEICCCVGIERDSEPVELTSFQSPNSQILERVKPDRVTVTKPEEDRRRRTIIVEKFNNSYGFTLQSYGIHYKKEQEIEMITYVDYVEYDGPAYRAGMREGDVILSINGHDMEKTDHKTLVNFIKNCDGRMRMVVLFEDCVRKVELHMRYIHLQRLLQTKMSELERLNVREKEVMEGKWKTHSLPARKKGSRSTESAPSPTHENGDVVSYCRPTMSNEDVARATPPPGFGPPIVLAYRTHQPATYVDQQGRPYLIQAPHSSREYVQAWSVSGYPSRSDSTKGLVRRCSASGVIHDSRGYHQSNGIAAAAPTSNKPPKVKSGSGGSTKSSSSHCNPCIQSATSPQDNTSLEAYDLASPCCNSHCVPSRRRRHHHKPKKSNSVESARGGEWKEKGNSTRSAQSSGYVSTASSGLHSTSHHNQNHHHHHHHHHHQSGRRYLSLVSQCSLHSCTSSEVNSVQEKAVGNDSSAASYTTSLSTDTLYWGELNGCDPQPTMTRQHSVKSNSSLPRESQAVKPKSWDNLTTKAFGGYGFGYGYVDRSQKSHGSKGSRRQTKYVVQPTKSSESLLLLPEYPQLNDSSLSCECLDATSPSPVPSEKMRFYTMPAEPFYHRDKASQTERRQYVNVSQTPEITRL